MGRNGMVGRQPVRCFAVVVVVLGIINDHYEVLT